MSHLIPPKTVHICEATSSDSKYYFSLVVDEIYDLENNIKYRHDFCSLTANADVFELEMYATPESTFFKSSESTRYLFTETCQAILKILLALY